MIPTIAGLRDLMWCSDVAEVISVSGELLHQRFFDYSYVTAPRAEAETGDQDQLPLKRYDGWNNLEQFVWSVCLGCMNSWFWGILWILWCFKSPFARFDDAATRAKWDRASWFWKNSSGHPDVGKTEAVEIFSDHRVAVGAYTNNRVTRILWFTGTVRGFNRLLASWSRHQAPRLVYREDYECIRE